MSKDHAEYLTEEQIEAEIAQMMQDIKAGKISEDEAERDAYFNDSANAKEIAEQQAQMDLIIALYNARKAANLTQKELAERMNTTQSFIARMERGRANITIQTLARYAAACGKRIALI